MSIEGTNKDLPHARSPYVGAGAHDGDPSTWERIKRWSSDNPRLSRVVWIALGLAILATGDLGDLPQAGRQQPLQSRGAAGGCGHGRERAHSCHAQCAGHGHAARHRHGQAASGRSSDQTLFHRRPDGESGRPARPDRSAPLSGGVGSGQGPACQGPGQSHQRQDGPCALSSPRGAERDLRSAIVDAILAGAVRHRRGRGRSGQCRSRGDQSRLYPHRVARRWPRWSASGRHRQYRAGGTDDGRGGGDRAFADVGALHDTGRQYLPDHGSEFRKARCWTSTPGIAARP